MGCWSSLRGAVFALFLLTAPPFAYADTPLPTLTPQQKEWLAAHPVIRAGTVPGWEPISMRIHNWLSWIFPDENALDTLLHLSFIALFVLILFVGAWLLRRANRSIESKVRLRTHALEEQTKELNRAQEITQLGHWIVAAETLKVVASEELAVIFDLDRDALTLDAVIARFHPACKDENLEMLNKGLQEGIPFDVRHRLIFDDGSVKWARSIGLPERDRYGTLVRLIGTTQDITRQVATEEEHRLQSIIVENMAEGVALTRAEDGVIIYTNNKLDQMLGYDEGELIGAHISVVNAPTDVDPAEVARQIIAQLRADGEWHGEVRNLAKDGTPIWCKANVSTFLHAEYGEVWISIHSEITEQKIAEEKLKKSEILWRSLTEHSSDHIMALDTDLRITFCNYASPGLTVDDLIGVHLYRFAAEERQEEIKTLLTRVLDTGVDETYDSSFTAPTGEEISYENIASLRMVDGEVVGLTVSARNISERKQVERMQASLAQARDYFASVTSHELATPLTNLSLVTLLLDEAKARCPDNEGIVKAGEVLRESYESISRIVSATTLATELTIHSGTTVCPTHDFSFILKLAIDVTLTKVKEAQREVALDVSYAPSPLWIRCDREHMEQAMLELLSNAVKYTPDGKKVCVTVEGVENEAILRIRDQGSGMSAEDQKEVVTPYYSPADVRKHHSGKYSFASGGLGLGLTIVKMVVENYGGSFLLEPSEEGEGASFAIKMPLAPEDSEAC